MIDLSTVKKVHVVGIGGIGTSALAQLFMFQGKEVTGSDRASSVITQMLEARRIPVFIGHDAGQLPENTDLLVFSDAVPFSSPERAEARRRKVPEMTYFEALGLVAKGKRTIAVSGTHGKTTTAGMITKILIDAGKNPTAIVGSIMKDFSSNFVAGSGDIFVVEACEYRKHLLHIDAKVLVITNIEWDHTDFFESFAMYQDAFREAAWRIPADGFIVTDPSLPQVAATLPDIHAKLVNYGEERSPNLMMLGKFNQMNACAAKAAVKTLFPELDDGKIDSSLVSFQGTWRRFEYKGVTPEGAQVYDDYGHHPTEVKATLDAAREKFPDKKIFVAFHPHLYTRTRDLMDEFANSFKAADECLVAPIFAAREEPIPGVDHKTLADKIVLKSGKALACDSLDAIETELRKAAKDGDIIITMGAGDIYKVAEALVEGQ